MKAPRRKMATQSLSYWDANKNRLVTEGPDVQDLKTQIRERYPSLEAFFDVWAEVWIIIEHCADGVDRMCAEIPPSHFNEQYVWPMLDRADQASRNHQDPLAAVEAWEAEQDKAEADRIHDICGDVGERLIHAFKKDGLADHDNIYGPRTRVDTRRLINR